MAKLHEEGRIVQLKPGNVPLQKRYLDEMNGRPIQDLWDDVTSAKTVEEKTGYPTQKPVGLLRRIIQVSSNPDDLVLDPFCGSGTTLFVSLKLGRRWIGVDSSKDACRIAAARLRKSCERTRIIS